MIQSLWKNLPVSYEGKDILSISNNSTPSYFPKGNETLCQVRRKSLTRMFIAALFIIVKNWKQPKCSSGDEQLNKLL